MVYVPEGTVNPNATATCWQYHKTSSFQGQFLQISLKAQIHQIKLPQNCQFYIDSDGRC